MSVEDSIKSEINSLSRDVESCHGSLVGGGVPDHYSKKEKRKEHFQEKQLHGQFWTNTAEVRDKKT